MPVYESIDALCGWLLRNRSGELVTAYANTLTALTNDRDPDVRAALLRNPSVPSVALTRFEADPFTAVRSAVGANPSTPGHVLARLGREQVRAVREAVATNAAAPPSSLDALAKDADPAVRSLCAANPSLDPQLLAHLAKDPVKRVRAAVAKNSRTPRDVLMVLAQTERELVVLEALATNTACSAEILLDLASSRSYAGESLPVRREIAANPSAPAQLIKSWSQRRDYSIRASLAKNPTCPTEVLTLLARDGDYAVRAAAALNPGTPPAVLQELATDSEQFVREQVARNPKSPRDVLDFLSLQNDVAIDAALITNPRINPELAVDLGLKVAEASWDTPSRVDVARSNLELRRVREVMALDSDPWVRATVAANAATPSDLVEMLAQDENNDVRSAAASNQKAVSDWLATYGETSIRRQTPEHRVALQVNEDDSRRSEIRIRMEGSDPLMWLSPSGRWLCIRTITGGAGRLTLVDAHALKAVATFELSDSYYDEYPIDVKWSPNEGLMSVVECNWEGIATEDDVPVLVVSMSTTSVAMSMSVPLADSMHYGISTALGSRFDRTGDRLAIDFATPSLGDRSDSPFGLAVLDINRQQVVHRFEWAPPGTQAVFNSDMTRYYLVVDPSYMTGLNSPDCQLWITYVDDSTYTPIDLDIESVGGQIWLSSDEKVLFVPDSDSEYVIEIDLNHQEVKGRHLRSEVELPVREQWSSATREPGHECVTSRNGQWLYEYDDVAGALTVRSVLAPSTQADASVSPNASGIQGGEKRIALEMPRGRE